MYELIGVSPSIVSSYYDAIEKADNHPNANNIFVVAVKNTFHVLEPHCPRGIAESYITKLLKPYFERKRLGIFERAFANHDEAIEIYKNQFSELLDALEKDSSDESKYAVKSLDCIYDLLLYDRVIMIDGKAYLSSWFNLEYWSDQHSNACDKRSILQQAKKTEKNIDMALNTNKAYRDRIKFLLPVVSPVNPFAKNEITDMKEEIVRMYVDEHHMTARAVYGMSQIMHKHSDISFVRAFGELEPEIDSDRVIPKNDIYESWYAYTIAIYNRSSKQTAPIAKVLELAKYYSYGMFPSIPKKRDLISLAKAKKPIREKSFFKGLKLYEFTDNRLKIERPKGEVQSTEEYLLEVTKQLNRLSKS